MSWSSAMKKFTVQLVIMPALQRHIEIFPALPFLDSEILFLPTTVALVTRVPQLQERLVQLLLIPFAELLGSAAGQLTIRPNSTFTRHTRISSICPILSYLVLTVRV